MSSIQDLIDREEIRRERRNLRDRLAREFLRDHPEIKSDPDVIEIKVEDIPEGTTVAAIRSIARFYSRKAEVRVFLRDRKDC